MPVHRIRVSRTARYYTLGEPGRQVRYCWIACHGYGQLAERFIRKFGEVEDEETLVIAPEGLSRFYLQGFSGQVGASWMTRADRLEEISDYCDYLQLLYDRFVPLLAKDVQIILFGFSQGCATQMRWIMREFPVFDHLVLWAGTIPEDLDYRPHQDYFASKSLHLIYGTEDPFLTEERLEWHHRLIAEQGLEFRTQTFRGKHTVHRPALRELEARIKGGS